MTRNYWMSDLREAPGQVWLSSGRSLSELLTRDPVGEEAARVFGASRRWVAHTKALLDECGDHSLKEALAIFDSDQLAAICVEIAFSRPTVARDFSRRFSKYGNKDLLPREELLAFVRQYLHLI